MQIFRKIETFWKFGLNLPKNSFFAQILRIYLNYSCKNQIILIYYNLDQSFPQIPLF